MGENTRWTSERHRNTCGPTARREGGQLKEVVPELEETDEQPLTFFEEDELLAPPRTDNVIARQSCEALGANPLESGERLRAALEQGYFVCLSYSVACSSDGGTRARAAQILFISQERR